MTRRSILTGLALAAWLLSAGSAVFAQGFSVTITVDENGNGTFRNTAGLFSPLPFAVFADQGPGAIGAALTYALLNPPGLVTGDLVLLEPDSLGTVSDLIRFNPNGTLVFYSDPTDGVDSLADRGFPTALYTNTFTAVEVGPEGNNGFSYTPTSTQPGFVAGATGPVTYVIRSDVLAVPEPSSVVLGGLLRSSVSASHGHAGSETPSLSWPADRQITATRRSGRGRDSASRQGRSLPASERIKYTGIPASMALRTNSPVQLSFAR